MFVNVLGPVSLRNKIALVRVFRENRSAGATLRHAWPPYGTSEVKEPRSRLPVYGKRPPSSISRISRFEALVAIKGLLILILFALSVVTPQRVQASDNKFCYNWNSLSACYGSKQEAYAALLAVIPVTYRDVIREKRVGPIGTVTSTLGDDWRIDFEIPNQPPKQIFSAGYHANGWSVPEGICASANDPIRPSYCIDGDAAAQSLYNYLVNRSPTCTYNNHGIRGRYAEPFGRVHEHQYMSPYGTITYSPDSTYQRLLSYDIYCPNWGTGIPDQRTIVINKIQTFLCDQNFIPVLGSPPAVTTLMCSARWPDISIRYYQRQTDTCPANDHPCHPATGDKSRNEVDFEFAGQSFTRYYHSLAQVQTLPAFAPGWTHTFSDRVITGGKLGIMRGDGYVEYFSSGSSTENSRKKLIKLGDGTYKLYEESGRILSFNSAGRLIRQEESVNSLRTIDFSYDGDRLIKAQDQAGRALIFNYADNRLNSIQLPDGGLVQYQFDKFGNFSRVTYPGGANKQYMYNESDLSLANDRNGLTGIVDENANRYASFGYAANGRVNSSKLHKGDGTFVATTTIDYTNKNQPVVTLPSGEIKTYMVQDDNAYRRITGITGSDGALSKTYSNGQLTQDVSRNGVLTKYEYTGGYLSAQYDAFGTVDERKTVYVRDANYRLTSQTTQAKSGTLYVSKQSQTWTYNARGQILTVTVSDPAATPLISQTTTTAYCEQTGVTAGSCPLVGLVTSVDGPRSDVSDVISYEHRMTDAASCVSAPATCPYRMGDLWKTANAAAQVTEILAYDGVGRVQWVKDVNGGMADFEYSPRGWLTAHKLRGPDNGSETDDQITRIEYWPTGLVKKVVQPDGAFIIYDYDHAHRLTDIRDQQGNHIHYTLDLAGNRTATEVKDPSGMLKRSHRNVYNMLNKLTQSIGADKGPNTQITYYDEYDSNGNLKKMRDAQGNITQYGYDPLNRLTTTLDALNGTTSYSYDGRSNLASVTDPRGNITLYQYDGLGNLKQLTSPDTGVTHYTAHDGAGNLLSHTDAKGQITGYQYDALNRLIQISYADSSTTVYQYDVGANAKGRLSTITDASGSTGYEYDLHGRISRKTQTINGRALAIAYRYNSTGQLDQITYPSGKVIGYVYGVSNGKVSQITINGIVALNNISYDPFGPTTGWQLGSSANSISRIYDLDGQLSRYTLGNITQQLSYDNTGNITTQQTIGNPANDQSYGYGYDNLNRLTSASGPQGTQGYGYDANGNRNSATLDGVLNPYTTAINNNRLQSANGKSYQYDNNGNITSDGLNGYNYDARNRLVGLNSGSGTGIAYGHNGLGQRVVKTIPGIDSTSLAGDANSDGIINAQDYSLILNHILGQQTASNSDCNQDGQTNVGDLVCINIKANGLTTVGTTRYAYDEQGQLIGEYDQTGTAIQETLYLGNLPVVVLKNSNVYYIHADHLNTPRAITDASNKTYWSWASDPFGTTAANDDVDGDGNKLAYNLRFPGQYYDQETNLHYNYFRDYDPATGRYVQSDPIGLAGGLNTYVYVGSNPLLYVDRFGLKQTCRWVSLKVYDVVTVEIIKSADGKWGYECSPAPNPAIGIPDPGQRKPGFPGDIEITVSCEYQWKWTSEGIYKQIVEKWTKGYMECTDNCTGKVTSHWGAPRPVSEANKVR